MTHTDSRPRHGRPMVKLAQIFPLGLLLGWLFKRHGVEASIGAHALFNVIGAFLCSPLIR